MGVWLKANGGPVAVVIVGVGISGFTSKWTGLVLIVIGVVWWFGAYLYKRLPWEIRRKAVRPMLSCAFLVVADHFWLEVSNDGPGEVPDPPLLLNLLVPQTWNVHAGGGNFAATRETLTAPDGTKIGAWEWSFMDDNTPLPRVRQKYEFMFKEAPLAGRYPVRATIHGYGIFDSVLEIGATEAEAKSLNGTAVEFGEKLAAFWEERERGKPAELDMFKVGSEAKNARDAERVKYEEETVRLYHVQFAQEATDHVRNAVAMHRLTADDMRRAHDPTFTNDIATLAARLRGLRPR